MLKLLDPEHKHIAHRLYRDSCICKNGRYLKDLRILKNRNPKNIIIVDNSIVCFSAHLSNGIYVPSYFGQCNDNCLNSLISLLKKIAGSENVQEELDKVFGLRELYEEFVENEEEDDVSS